MWMQALSNQVQHVDKNHLGNAGKENGSMALSLKCKPSVRGDQAGLVQKQRESSVCSGRSLVQEVAGEEEQNQVGLSG